MTSRIRIRGARKPGRLPSPSFCGSGVRACRSLGLGSSAMYRV